MQIATAMASSSSVTLSGQTALPRDSQDLGGSATMAHAFKMHAYGTTPADELVCSGCAGTGAC